MNVMEFGGIANIVRKDAGVIQFGGIAISLAAIPMGFREQE